MIKAYLAEFKHIKRIYTLRELGSTQTLPNNVDLFEGVFITNEELETEKRKAFEAARKWKCAEVGDPRIGTHGRQHYDFSTYDEYKNKLEEK